jgi:hypothetical protein
MIPTCDAVSRFVSTGLTVLAPVSAMAQEAAAPVSPPSWRFQISADGAWYQNTYFVAGNETTAWSTGGQASLTRQGSFRRGSFSLGGHGGMIYYPEVKSFNQATYGGNLGLAWASRHTQVHIAQVYDRSNTRQLASLAQEALPLPTSGLDTATTTLGISQGLSRRWQLAVDGAFTWRRYDNEALVGGEQLSSSAQLARQVGRTGAISLSYGFSSSWFGSTRARTHQALLGGRRQKGRVGFELGAGAAYVESVGQAYPAGHAGLTVRGRKTSLALGYRRDFGQAFGYGRETIADLASASLGWTLVRRLNLGAGYSFGYRRDPAETDYVIRSHAASAGFDWGIAKDLGFAARYSWERNQIRGLEPVEGGRVTASLSYGVSWR